MKKKLLSLIAFALALVMAMTSLPVGAVLAASAEKVEQLSELHEHTEEECLGGLHEHDESYDNARELTKLWYEDKLRTNGTTDAELNNLLNAYFSQREAAWLVNTKAFDFDKRIDRSIVATNRERRVMIRDFAKRMGFDIVDSKVTVLFDDASFSKNVDGTMTISAYEWTFFDYRYPDSSSIDTSGIGTWHNITFSNNENDISIIMDEYDESDMFGICTITDSAYNPIAYSNPMDAIAKETEMVKTPKQGSYDTRYTFFTDYNVNNVVTYADQYWSNYNPAYANYNSVGGDCANYTSQCIYAGGMPMVYGASGSQNSWYYRSSGDRSGTWTVAPYLRNWMGTNRGIRVDSPTNADIFTGSPVFYNEAHATICVGKNSAGVSIVNSHNADRYHVTWNYWGADTTYYTVKLTATDGNATPPEHTCNKGELVFFESSHPHCNCYRCSICGQIWRDTNSSNHVDSCTDCNRPAKPVISAVNSIYGTGQNIVFRWTTGANTTHCNFVLYIKENGEWKVRQRTNYANSGLSVTASNGDYRVLVLAYNSNMWEVDGSDWLHTYSDYVYYSVKSYTITWKNYDGTTLETDTNVPHGTTPTYNGSTPSRPATAQYTYTFSGWSPTVAAATGNKTYTAQYNSTVNKYTVTFKNWDGTVLKTQTVNYGSAATAPANPTRPGYTFTGWDKAFNNVTSNLTVNAQYSINTYSVTFKDWNGTILKTQTVNHGGAATAPANPSRPGYTFTGWDKAFNNVTSNLVVTAQYAAAVPDKPIVAANGGYDLSAAVEGWTSVLVDWNNYGSNATHFDVKAYDANTNELIETVSNLTARGYSFSLPVGHYKFTVTAKNMNVNPNTSVTSDMSEAVEVKDYRYGFYSASGIVTYQGHSYAILSEIKTSDWHKAKELCEYLGGHLATITSAGENAVIQDLIFSHSSYTAGTFLGATNEGNGNDWEWITGEPFDYTNWAANEPSNWLGLEHYLSMYNSDGTWADVRSGNWNRQIVIEFDYVFGSYPVEVVATDNYNGHEYTMFRNIGLTWQEAKTFCELRGGTLVCINDEAEQNFVSQLASEIEFGYAYIGATDAANDGAWVWLDGSPVTYSNWGGAEPNGGENENIAIIRLCTYNYGTWMDLTGENQLCYIIMEKEVEAPVTEPPTNPPVTEPPITPAPDAPQIIVGSKTATQGSTVTVDVSLLNNPGIVSMALTVDFNERLSLASVTDTGLIPGQVHSPTMGNPYTLFWSNDTALENYVVDGVLATLTFEIPEDMPVGEYPITISYDLDNYDIYNCDVETVEFAVVNGKVNVIDVLIGDVNTDTKVNNLDKLVFTRYLAKWADYPETVINMIAADVNLDTKVNNLDKLILTRHLARWAGYETLPYTAKSAHEAKHAEIKGDEPTIIVDSVTAEPGETVTVNVSLANNPGIVSMSLTMAFDPMLELVAVNDTGLLPGKVHSPTLGNPYTLFWANDTALENYVVNGSLVELTFKLSENAEPGTYPITITYDLDNYDIYNCDVELVEFAVVNGGVTYLPDEPTTHTVTFIDPITGEVIAEVEVEHGEAAEAPEAPAHEWYTFTGWDADFSAVTEDITVTAQYVELGDLNGDGTVEMDDALAYMRWLIGSDEIACDEAEADFNSDGKTDLMDALLLMRHILGTI